jgi:hypothetical protein
MLSLVRNEDCFMEFKRERGIPRFALVYNKKFTLKLQKSRMSQTQSIEGEVTLWCDFASSTDLIAHKPLTRLLRLRRGKQSRSRISHQAGRCGIIQSVHVETFEKCRICLSPTQKLGKRWCFSKVSCNRRGGAVLFSVVDPLG